MRNNTAISAVRKPIQMVKTGNSCVRFFNTRTMSRATFAAKLAAQSTFCMMENFMVSCGAYAPPCTTELRKNLPIKIHPNARSCCSDVAPAAGLAKGTAGAS